MPTRDRATSGQNQSAARSQPASARAVDQQAPTPTSASGLTAGAADRQPQLGPDLQALIGQQLRAVYHEVLSEPVPDRFVRLLEELAAKQADRS